MRLQRIGLDALPADAPPPHPRGETYADAWQSLAATDASNIAGESAMVGWEISKYWETEDGAVLVRAEREDGLGRMVALGAVPEFDDNLAAPPSPGALVFFAELLEWVADAPLARPGINRVYPLPIEPESGRSRRDGTPLAPAFLLAALTAMAALWLRSPGEPPPTPPSEEFGNSPTR